jgi:multidrug resistance protein
MVRFTYEVNLELQVTWEGPNDVQNPRNWSLRKRWTTTLTIACFTLLSPLTSTMISPAVNAIGTDLHDGNAVHLELTLSIFLLGLGFGPLVLSPISEMHGRLPVLIVGNLFFIVWNTASGFVHTTGQLMAFRLLAGLGASAPLAIGGGLLSDLWEPERRGQALAMYTSGPLLGPALGPIIGAYVTQRVSWRWVFWVISIASGCFQAIALLFLTESYPPKLLSNKAKRLRIETGNQALHTQYEEPDRTLPKLLKTNLVRPVKLLSTQVIIQILSLLMALSYGIMYIVLFTFPTLWTGPYHEAVGVSSLNYISIGLGFVVGSQGSSHGCLSFRS